MTVIKKILCSTGTLTVKRPIKTPLQGGNGASNQHLPYCTEMQLPGHQLPTKAQKPVSKHPGF